MSSHKPAPDEERSTTPAREPESAAQARERAARMEALAKACALDEAALVHELRDAGEEVATVWDLSPGAHRSSAAVAVLVAHLERPHHPRIWEGIVRALSSRAARGQAFEPLRRLYGSEADPARRWALANAIGAMAGFEEVRDLEGISGYRALFRQSTKPPYEKPGA